MKPLAFLDFETNAIQRRPRYPPKPAGVAVKLQGKKPRYWAWGHPTGNNCSLGDAAARLARIWRDYTPVFHNSQFDCDVGNTHLGLPIPTEYHDTLFLAFLRDPHARSLELKELAPKELNYYPEERDLLSEWIREKIKGAARGKTTWREHIADAPGDLVGEYACADVVMTELAFDKFYPQICQRGMREAYRRELACMPITLEMERGGLRVSQSGLIECGEVFKKAQAALYKLICRKLNVGTGFNLNSGAQLAKALIDGGFLRDIERTAPSKRFPEGQVSTSMQVLTKNCRDKKLIELLGMHSVVEKSQNTFIYPWLEQAALSGGRILPKYNQTRGTEDGGTRSGRLSSSDPNLQQVPADVEESRNREILIKLQQFLLERFEHKFTGLRAHLLPDHGAVGISCDYSQQELRLLAHFENGELCRRYNADPKFDPHGYIQADIKEKTGLEHPRKFVKVTVFSRIYGAGKRKVQMQLGCDYATAEAVYDGISSAVPGIDQLNDELRELARLGLPLRTWGGREYYCEPDAYVEKYERNMSFEYKMLNFLIQPSAADMTKQGMIQIRQSLPDIRIAVQVHDELFCMAASPKDGKRVAEVMCDMKLRVPILAEPKYSVKSWGELKLIEPGKDG